jgi:hypothetical protein
LLIVAPDATARVAPEGTVNVSPLSPKVIVPLAVRGEILSVFNSLMVLDT